MMKIMIVLCLMNSFALSRRSWRHRNQKVSVSFEDISSQLDQHNHWLQHTIKKEPSTLYEIPYFSNDAPLSTTNEKQKQKEEDYLYYMKLANQNVQRVRKKGKCKIPTQLCLNMHKRNPQQHKVYWPTCALVHRCSEDSGCCDDRTHICSPVKTQTIALYFFLLNMGNSDGRGSVEMFTFENHTECGCMPPSSSAEISYVTTDARQSCKCPKHFIPSRSTEECLCVCDEKQTRGCRKIIRGKKTYHYKGCKGTCHPPLCEYGVYMPELGRCPRRRERKNRRKYNV